jgi:hypothetical protein
MNSLEMQEYNTENISLLTTKEEQRDLCLRRKGNKEISMERKKRKKGESEGNTKENDLFV